MTTLVLADDSALIRDGLAGLLERRGYTVVAREASADALRATVDRLVADGTPPDGVVTDVRMPPGMTNDGLEAAIAIRQRHPQVAVMVLSQYVSASYAQRLFSLDPPPGAGGSGYLLKDRVSDVADFLTHLDVVLHGGVVIDPEVARSMMRASRTGLGTLTPRELEVLELMARGRSNTEIAEELVVSGAAVAKHVSSIFMKLGLDPSEENRRVRAILAYLGDTSRP
ncbi:response regulator transcription factor [uncultured Tessaracoccus sp.]|uniref:response regulator transcription factor n=1 Tax=uncultured Tessaracoccus sp. TaxID=905023 RepID=UPI0025FC5D09|nr:response regulator transcription factor [uncultured Tessaracoccus sp.]